MDLLKKTGGIISLGGDHTIAFPLLKAVNKINNGPVALVHFCLLYTSDAADD